MTRRRLRHDGPYEVKLDVGSDNQNPIRVDTDRTRFITKPSRFTTKIRIRIGLARNYRI